MTEKSFIRLTPGIARWRCSVQMPTTTGNEYCQKLHQNIIWTENQVEENCPNLALVNLSCVIESRYHDF